MKFNLFFNPNLWHHLINRSAPIIFLFGFMKTLLWNQKCLVLILMAVLLTFGMQDTTYGQICQAGMIIEPGKSCTLPNGTDTFSVDASGRGSLEYGFITVEGGIHIRSRKLTLVASKQADGSWEIEEVEGAKPTEIVTEVFDPGSPPIYWTDADTAKIQRANLHGTDVQDLITTGLGWPSAIALDVAGGKMYWTDWRTRNIQRANLDGTDVQDLVTGLDTPTGIALDVAGGKMYWTDWSAQKIQRANNLGRHRRTRPRHNGIGLAIGYRFRCGGRKNVLDRLDLAKNPTCEPRRHKHTRPRHNGISAGRYRLRCGGRKDVLDVLGR